ncbi:hypothetical protein SRHO_G00073330 [Serrasalmus rhombeus]
MKGSATSDEETDEENDLFEHPELANRRREWKIHSSPIPLELKHRQYARKKLIHDLCDNNGTLGFNGKWQTIDDISNWELANLLYILSLPADRYELLDEHWRQTAHLCHPCQIHYDFIGKMETMEEDAADLLRMLRVDNIVQFPKIKSSITDENWVKTWFPTITADSRRKLFKLFETDYKYLDTKFLNIFYVHKTLLTSLLV